MIRPDYFLILADSHSDTITCYVRTEYKKLNILIRSNVNSRRLNIRTDKDYVSNDP